MPRLNQQAMDELRPLHEEWAGAKLRNGQVLGRLLDAFVLSVPCKIDTNIA